MMGILALLIITCIVVYFILPKGSFSNEPIISRKGHLTVFSGALLNRANIARRLSNDNFEYKLIAVDAMRFGKESVVLDESDLDSIEKYFKEVRLLSNKLDNKLKVSGLYGEVSEEYDRIYGVK